MLNPPPLQPFQRLRIYDGLSIDADRWKKSHHYHRRRQNFHYQALHQGGIVAGLGIRPIADPTAVATTATAKMPSKQASRWVEIQPGMAIDGAGNPIVVTEPFTFQLQSAPRQGESLTVYLVVNYRDPDDLRQLNGNEKDYVQEVFRVQERTQLDSIVDVEIGRIRLTPGADPIVLPADLMAATIADNTLDIRHRQVVQAKPQSMVNIAHLSNHQDAYQGRRDRWQQLMKSLPSIYAQLQGTAEIPLLSPIDFLQRQQQSYDLVCIDQVDLIQQSSSPDVIAAFKHHLSIGGMLLVQTDPYALNLGDLTSVAQELRTAIAQLPRDQNFAARRLQLQTELAAIDLEITTQLEQIPNQLAPIATLLGNPITNHGRLDPLHPLRSQPFIFGQLPNIDGQQLYLLNWGGIVVMVGDLSLHWVGDETLSREAIRSAQELGVNLLHFAWQRRQRTALISLT
jgi:hypothetical protein